MKRQWTVVSRQLPGELFRSRARERARVLIDNRFSGSIEKRDCRSLSAVGRSLDTPQFMAPLYGYSDIIPGAVIARRNDVAISFLGGR
jgi:hypothetical protein